MELEITQQDESTAILKLIGDFDLYHTQMLKKEINNMVDEGVRFLICDLARVPYIDSSGIGALMVSLSALKKKGGRFMMVGLNETVLKVLELTKMTTFFEIYGTLEEALSKL